MTVYIDEGCKCFTAPAEGRMAIDTDFFDGKCRAFIEGYIYVPGGKTWTRADGKIFTGELIAPWRDFALLEEFQHQYGELLSQQEDMRRALDAIYGGVTDE